jgi:hypothetical protein
MAVICAMDPVIRKTRSGKATVVKAFPRFETVCPIQSS